MKRKCVYCNRELDESEFTKEHVIPKGIGGNAETNNPFLLYDVCKRCNNLSGIYIDGPFIKQWLINNAYNELISRYADISTKPILPIRYMGLLEDMKYEDKICEVWLGPTGDIIYHFHKPYKLIENLPMVGKPTYLRSDNIDHGFVFLFITSNNPVWYPTIIKSVKNNFDKSIIYLGNNGSHNCPEIFSEIPNKLNGLRSKLIELSSKKKLKLSFAISMHADDRILCKIGLGIGSILLNKNFRNSNNAEILRKGMWAKEPKDIVKLNINGDGFFNHHKNFSDKILRINNCHTIALINIGNALALHISLFGLYEATIILTDDKSHWSNDLIRDFGVAYVIAPGLKKCLGPISMASFIAFKLKNGGDEKLYKLEKLIDNIPEKPPFRI